MMQPHQPIREIQKCRDCGATMQPTPINGPFAITIPYCRTCAARRADAALEKEIAAKLSAWRKLRGTWLDQSGIPGPAIGTKLLSTFDPNRGKAARTGYIAASRWLEQCNSDNLNAAAWPVLFGKSNGTGKTHLLYAMLQGVIDQYVPDEDTVRMLERAARDAAPEEYHRIMREQRQRTSSPVLCYNAWELLMAVAEARRPKSFSERPSETEYELLQRIINVPVLGIDDWGRTRTRRDMEEQHHIWYTIVDGRDKRGLPIIATSNMPLEEMDTVMGYSTVDRLVGRCIFVPMEGESQRGRRA